MPVDGAPQATPLGKPLTALDVIEEITGETEVNALGYCLGGILLAILIAWLEAKGRHDPCVVPRAVPIVETMAALVLADLAMMQASRQTPQG